MTPHIFIGSDHLGYAAKHRIIELLTQKGIDVTDLGPYVLNPQDDYTDFAIKVARHVQKNKNSRGILVCGSGVGMYLVANKFPGIRAAESRTKTEAIHDRAHHDSNVLVLGTTTVPIESYSEIIDAWIITPFEQKRHSRRMKKLQFLESFARKEYNSPFVVPILLEQTIDGYDKAKQIAKFSKVINIDIADGIFVPSKTPTQLEILSKVAPHFDLISVHLMVQNPYDHLVRLASNEKVFCVYVHIEKLTKQIFSTEWPFEICYVISDYTKIELYKDLYPFLSSLQVMTVPLGKQGGALILQQLTKIDKIRELGFSGEIHIDGGVNQNTVPTIMRYFPDVLNVGSAISKSSDPKQSYKEILKMAHKATLAKYIHHD